MTQGVRAARRFAHGPRQGATLMAFLLGFASLSLGACRSEEPHTGSQTNWLKSCSTSDDCGDLSCVCGTCTLTCSDAESCSESTSGECVPTDDEGAVALCNGFTPESALCLQRCDDAECPSGSHCIAGICSPEREASVKVAVDLSATGQEIVGFGASISYDGDAIIAHPQRAALFDAMFSDSGLDIIRLRSRWNGDNPGELVEATEIVAEAEARMESGPLVMLTSPSPPPNLKVNGARFCPQLDPNCTLTRTATGEFDYAGFGEYWRSALEAYEGAGVVPDFLSIQNNPDWLPAFPGGGEACRFLPEEGTAEVTLTDGTTVDAEFPGYVEALEAVRTAIAPLGRSHTIVAPDAGNLAALAPYTDVLVPGSYDAVAYHLFGTTRSNVPFETLEEVRSASETTGVPHFQTEMGADGLGTAVLIHHTFVTAGGSAYIQDQFVAQGLDQNGSSPIGSDAETFELQPVYFAYAHFARPTAPGWLLAQASDESEEILASAWISPDGSDFAIVLVNQSDNYTDVEVAVPGDLEAALLDANVTRTVFNGIERAAELGALPPDRTLRIPGRALVTIASAN